MIAAYYNISYVTVEVYTLSLKERTKLKGLLEVVSSSAEFESIPIRRHEDVLLRRIYDRVPVKLDRADFEAPHFKTFLLLQAHFSRIQPRALDEMRRDDRAIPDERRWLASRLLRDQRCGCGKRVSEVESGGDGEEEREDGVGEASPAVGA